LLTFFERVTAITVTIDFEHGKAAAEILVDAEHKHNFVSHDEANDVISAYDGAFHKMEQQLKKYKEKLQDHRRDIPMSEAFPGPLVDEEEKEEDDDEEEDDDDEAQ
jgi:putative sigma-54 modulation protein